METTNINKTLLQSSQFLQDFLIDEIIKENLLRTGNLARSVVVVPSQKEDTTQYNITMAEYGYYQDSGVKGSGKSTNFIPNPESFFKAGTFKSRTIPWKPRTPFSFPAARSIAQNGLMPRPFINDSLNRFEDKLGEDLNTAGELDIEGTIGSMVIKNGGTI